MSKVRKIVTIILITLLIVCILTGCLIFLLLEPNIKINSFTSFDEQRLVTINKTLEIYDENHKLINNNIYDYNKIYTKLNEISLYCQKAFIAIEDKRFYKHHGVDYFRIASATIKNISSLSFKEGASTITQQLVKNTHLSNEKTLKRKINEIRIAKELERKHSKQDILECYLNILYFGNNIYGIGTASQVYFDKKPDNLSLAESCILAGIINNPSKYNPFTHLDNSIKRMKIVLKQMLEQNLITKDEYQQALNQKIKISNNKKIMNQYINSVISQAQEILDIDKYTLFEQGYKIETFYDENINSLLLNISSLINSDYLNNTIILDNNSGKIIGNFSNCGYDVTNLKRQPGSTIKPLIYAKALQDNKISPITPILDERMCFNNDYCPSNYNDKYLGWTNINDSLKYSLNIPAIKILEMNGIDKTIAFAKKFGLKFHKNDYHPSIALGGMTKGITLLDICNAYQVFANNGIKINTSFIKEIRNKNNDIIYKFQPCINSVIRNDTAYFINKILQDCAKSGTGKKLNCLKTTIACKTGTVGNQNGNSDAYCIAYNPDYTIGVWIGSKGKLMPNNITGGSLCAKIIKEICKTNYFNSKKFEKPNSVISLPIDNNELIDNHKILLANAFIKPKDIKMVEFSIHNYPTQFSKPDLFLGENDILDNFNNFNVINSFFY